MKSRELTLVTANISWKNPMDRRVLRKLDRRRPDILCLQEVVLPRVEMLKNLGYAVGQAEDYRHIKGASSLVATGIRNKQSVISLERVRYTEKKIISLVGLFVYSKIAKLHERYEAVLATFWWGGKKYRVVNAHLSIACRPRDRVAQLELLLTRYADGNTFFCGDFNVVGDSLFRLLIGWACGYHLSDYFFDERKAVNELIARHKLQNPFAHRKTTRFPFHQQFDHILVPEQFTVAKKRMQKISLSDHQALLVTVRARQ